MERELVAQGIPCYLPLERVRQVRRGRAPETVDRPLYPTYLFAAYADEFQRHDIRRTRFVSELVLTATEHEQDALAGQIRSLEKALAVDPFLESMDWCQRGRKVIVTHGAFTGVEGEILRRERRIKDRVIVRDVLSVGVIFLGRTLEVDIDPAFVEPID